MDHYLRTPRAVVVGILRLVSFGCLLLQTADLQAQAGQPCSSALTTAAMLNCENARYHRAQRDLNALYARLLNKQDAIGKGKLRAAETAWLQFRKANADFLADTARGGTMAPLIAITTLTDMTEARTADLRKSLQ